MKNINYFYIIILYFYSINSNIEVQDLLFNNENFSICNLNKSSFFKITPESNSNLPNYLQIFVKGYN